MATTVSVVIITNNSAPFIVRCLQHLEKQSRSVHEVIIVDNKSQALDREALRAAVGSAKLPSHLVELEYNVGYPGGCNVATDHLSRTCDYVLYVGPDTYLTEGYVASGIAFMEDPMNRGVGAVSGKLLGFDNEAGRPTGLIDSTGILQTWYGRWYDRGKGRRDSENDSHWSSVVPALCGTALFCRRTALAKLEAAEPFTIYDNSLFMYKEDIDLSIRLVEAGFEVRYHSAMLAYHCRGWDRRGMSRRAKNPSARKEDVINTPGRLPKYFFFFLQLYPPLK